VRQTEIADRRIDVSVRLQRSHFSAEERVVDDDDDDYESDERADDDLPLLGCVDDDLCGGDDGDGDHDLWEAVGREPAWLLT
jgi:hypothetical protein